MLTGKLDIAVGLAPLGRPRSRGTRRRTSGRALALVPLPPGASSLPVTPPLPVRKVGTALVPGMARPGVTARRMEPAR